MNEDMIKNEMRFFALESIVCHHIATFYQAMPREFFDAMKKQAITGTQRLLFPGFDTATSDLLLAEFQTAIERLYGMVQNHLDKAQGRRNP